MLSKNRFKCRYFNKLILKDDIIIKSSIDKYELKNEYFTCLSLPDKMKKWFVTPFEFEATNKTANYKMKYYPLNNLAYMYVYGLITNENLIKILNKLFEFINSRTKKKISNIRSAYDKMYLIKLNKRVQLFKKYHNFKNIECEIKRKTRYSSFNQIVDRYKNIYTKAMKNIDLPSNVVIGHGDLCFSNILCNMDDGFMIFIDPKGFETKNEMWINPYYDIAKLSHSICGKYDFINYKKYSIRSDREKVGINIKTDISQPIELFKKYLFNNGYDYKLTRIFEISLFLSMLPMHVDDEDKIFGFILNAIDIMDEIEKK